MLTQHILAAIIAQIYSNGTGPGQTMLSSGYLGANLRAVPQWTGSMMYVDAIRNARSFAKPATPYANPGYVDSSQFAAVKPGGWPSESFSILFVQSVSAYPYQAGTYQGSFTGTCAGITSNGCTVQNVRVEGAKTRFEVVVDSTATNPYLTFTTPSTDFADLRLIRPGYAWDSTQLLTNEYLATIQNYSCLRMMDHQRTSEVAMTYPGFGSGDQTTFANRWTPTSSIWGQILRPYTIEEQILIANTTNKDLWLCIPHAADDSYIEGLLNLVWSTLSPGLHCYIEYSNEIWNPGLAYQPQLQHVIAKGREETGLFGGDNTSIHLNNVVISGGGTLATFDFKVPHGVVNGAQVKAMAGTLGGATAVPPNTYTATVVSSTVLTVPVTGRTDGAVTMGSKNTFVLTKPASDLCYDWNSGYSGSTWWTQLNNEYAFAYRYAGKRMARVGQIANTLFGSGNWLGRIRPVFSLQYVQFGTAAWVINYLIDNYGPISSWLYAISGAVYVSTKTTDTTASSILSTLETNNEEKKAYYYYWVNAARYIGIKFVQYEIGTDMVVSQASQSEKIIAEEDSRMTAITRNMLKYSMEMGCDSAMFYIEGVANGGGNFDLRQTPFDTAGDNPRLKGLLEALALPSPANYPAYWSTKIPTATASNLDYERSPMVSLVGATRAYAVSAGNFVFDRSQTPAGATVYAEFAFNLYVPADGTYAITPSIAAHLTTMTFHVTVDGVDQGVNVSAPSINVYSTTAAANAQISLSLQKGWRILRFISSAPVTTKAACAGISIT